MTELTRISDFLGESNSFGSQYVDSTVAQCLHVANQKLLNEDTFFKWFFKEPQIIVWLPTFYRMNVAKSVRHDVRCAHCRAQIVGLRLVYNLFVTSKNETTNSPIHKFKVLHKGQRAYKNPFLIVYHFLFITLKNIIILAFFSL